MRKPGSGSCGSSLWQPRRTHRFSSSDCNKTCWTMMVSPLHKSCNFCTSHTHSPRLKFLVLYPRHPQCNISQSSSRHLHYSCIFTTRIRKYMVDSSCATTSHLLQTSKRKKYVVCTSLQGSLRDDMTRSGWRLRIRTISRRSTRLSFVHNIQKKQRVRGSMARITWWSINFDSQME